MSIEETIQTMEEYYGIKIDDEKREHLLSDRHLKNVDLSNDKSNDGIKLAPVYNDEVLLHKVSHDESSESVMGDDE